MNYFLLYSTLYRLMSVYYRFFLSLMLRVMLKMEGSQSVWIVAIQFQCFRDFLQSLLQSASSFAFSLVQFTEVRT